MQVKAGDSVSLVSEGATASVKVTKVNPSGIVDVKLADGTKVSGVRHVSVAGTRDHWFAHDITETITPQVNPAFIELSTDAERKAVDKAAADKAAADKAAADKKADTSHDHGPTVNPERH